jgi:hypothetical protein
MILVRRRFAGWRTSSFSTAGQSCVEVALTDRAVGVRDSKNPRGAALVVNRSAWLALIDTAKADMIA